MIYLDEIAERRRYTALRGSLSEAVCVWTGMCVCAGRFTAVNEGEGIKYSVLS